MDDFIDRVTWKAISGAGVNAVARKTSQSSFPNAPNATASAASVDISQLSASLDTALRQLSSHRNSVEKRFYDESDKQRSEECRMDEKLQRIKKECWHKVNFTFQQLGKRVSGVSSSVTQLTEQIEALNGPISRLADARGIVEHFAMFMADTPVNLKELSADPKKLAACADTHLKLYTVVQDLPNEREFEALKYRVNERCAAIEQLLIQEFRKAYKVNDVQQMHALAASLSTFKVCRPLTCKRCSGTWYLAG